MSDKYRKLRLYCLRKMMKAAVRFCIRGQNSINDFIAVAKVAFVEVAEEELSRSTQKINVSRISILTGLHRKDVTRIFREEETPEPQVTSILARVLGYWEQDPQWQSKSGKPRVLEYRGEGSEFREMVKDVSQSIDPSTVLFELERIGAIQLGPRGAKLIQQDAKFHGDPRRGFDLLAEDAQLLSLAVEENVINRQEIPNLHIRTEYDNISQEALPEARQWLLREGQKFHKRARDYLSSLDKDLNPDIEDEAGVSVILGSFSFTADEPPV